MVRKKERENFLRHFTIEEIILNIQVDNSIIHRVNKINYIYINLNYYYYNFFFPTIT